MDYPSLEYWGSSDKEVDSPVLSPHPAAAINADNTNGPCELTAPPVAPSAPPPVAEPQMEALAHVEPATPDKDHNDQASPKAKPKPQHGRDPGISPTARKTARTSGHSMAPSVFHTTLATRASSAPGWGMSRSALIGTPGRRTAQAPVARRTPRFVPPSGHMDTPRPQSPNRENRCPRAFAAPLFRTSSSSSSIEDPDMPPLVSGSDDESEAKPESSGRRVIAPSAVATLTHAVREATNDAPRRSSHAEASTSSAPPPRESRHGGTPVSWFLDFVRSFFGGNALDRVQQFTWLCGYTGHVNWEAHAPANVEPEDVMALGSEEGSRAIIGTVNALGSMLAAAEAAGEQQQEDYCMQISAAEALAAELREELAAALQQAADSQEHLAAVQAANVALQADIADLQARCRT
ncbi:hypothetical protein HYH03_018719 [Edaphochlamys debaryana]|uniref:Uncharacterized protein n=1 Tax=Edaphochlamys debaryana TaxID=47281 RepID=A0A836BP37_9CHLO|nr:hypothetical protein HYH03_018719 [Edaphochlamys debaryana]|eukprot:KAG2482349.1 hypothetical protein HYH03_018719 [Edaphochlamys debaryana]